MKITDIPERAMRTILVTGGAKRIGKSITEQLGCENNRILIHYNNSDQDAKKLQNDLIDKQIETFIYKADLSKVSDINNMLEQISKDVGTDLDTIINCASIFEDDSARNIEVENFSRHMNTNLLAPILLSKYLFKIHRKDRDNNIINIIDQRVMRLNPSYFSYSISKFGLWGVTQMTAQEYSPSIRVNAIAPGPILANHDQSDEVFETEANNTPLQKQPNIKDISNAINFLLNTESVTGQIIAIDSGQHLSWKTPDFIEN
ncbi:SDR family oxidoreductase [Gammaproteobacteria bacterium]|nr:SDR family oxidoreductase [Gammaproteobacteria bacterium]